MQSDIIFVSLENWDDIWRRNQFICAELSRRNPNRKILFVGLPHDVSHALRRGKLSQIRSEVPTPLPDYPNIWTFRPVKMWPNSLKFGRKANEKAFRKQVGMACQKLGISNALLWLNPHSAVHMVGEMGETASLYDITDDWISLNQSAVIKQLIAEADAELCRRADATVVCSQRLFEMKTPLAKNLTLIPNGVDAAHYAGVADGSAAPNKATKSWARPVLGYVGTIHPDRVDVDLVEAVARAFPKGTVALVGPNLLGEGDLARLSALKNVAITGPVSYREVPHYLAAFDVCLVPHIESQFTESLNPIKLWEYLATGKPVVSTDVAGFRDFAELCHIASGVEAFIAACQAALGEDVARKTARLEVARANSWSARVDQIQAVLAALDA